MENIIDPHNEIGMAPKRNLPRDVFLHLFAIVTLYWSAISFITMCWQYINHFFPDALDYNYGYNDSMIFAISSIVIVYPLFILVSWFLNKIYSKESQVRDSKVRKWLIYLTLFITALVIIGDLVYTMNAFLRGGLTIRFVLKALSIIAVTGVIFWYYLDDVKRSAPSKLAKLFAIICSIIVAVFFVGAFFIVGSPATARALQFDQQRVNDLQTIQWQIIGYWQAKGVLPNSLNDLNNNLSSYSIPVDPQTNTSYQYIIEDATALKFQLCATFNLDSKTNSSSSLRAPAPVMYNGDTTQNWNHAAGTVCFDRTIDPQFYPPLNKAIKE